MKRRQVLVAGAAAGSAGALSISACSVLPVIPKRPLPKAEDAGAWLRHAPGAAQPFVLTVPCAEMGQHIGEALRRIAARELGVAASLIALRAPATDTMPRVKATVGSDSVKDFAPPLRRACADLRGRLALRGEAPAVPGGAAPAAPTGGEGVEPAYLREIVTGAPLYAADMRAPGMVYGRVLRAPASPELPSRPLRWDEAAARAVPGFVALVVGDEALNHAGSRGLGIVAATPGGLERIERALGVQWAVEGSVAAQAIDAALDIDAHLAGGALRHTRRRDEVDRGEGAARSDSAGHGSAWNIDLRIDIPYAAHAAIEPRAALAAFEPDPRGGIRLVVHSGTQDLFYVRDVLARRLALAEDRVRVVACRIGGGFGARTLVLAEVEAALLARAAGRPVQVMWSRAQEFAQGFHRPPSSHRVRARLERPDGGRITEWWHAFTSSHILFTAAAMPAWMQRAADFVGDAGVARGAALPYSVPRQRIEFDALRLPVHSGPWRGLGAGPNGLVVESAIDACARAAGSDALAFRLAQLDDARLAAVLRAVAADAGWTRRAAVAPGLRRQPGALPGNRRGRGLACGIYKEASRIAVVAEVEIDDAGVVTVSALWAAHDCGPVADADGVRAQVEGCLVWSIGLVLVEALPLGDKGVAASSFGDSPIPRIGQLPPMQVRLIDTAGAPTTPSGAGESAMTAGAAAIANAVFDATGVRVRRVPIDHATLRRKSPRSIG